jgi:hypothetical protein
VLIGSLGRKKEKKKKKKERKWGLGDWEKVYTTVRLILHPTNDTRHSST